MTSGTVYADNKTVYYAPPLPKPATFLILERGKNIRVVPLTSDMSIGRKDSGHTNDISLDSAIVSGQHGSIIYMDGCYYYKDNNSLNGTFYNGEKLPPYNKDGTKAVKLTDGDILRVDCSDLSQPHEKAVELIFSTTFSEDDSWKHFSLKGKKKVIIGRNYENGISLSDFMVSKEHAILQVQGKKWEIVDNNSKNGIAVNKVEIDRSHPLYMFDVIRIANTTLIFMEDEIIYNDVHSKNIPNSFDYEKRSVLMQVHLDEVATKIKEPRKLFSKKKTLLKDIHLDIEAGDFTLVLAGAGAGKSTFIKAITGQQRSETQTLYISGQILLDGMDLYKNLRFLKHQIGIVPQHPDFCFEDTVYHTIMDSAKIRLSGGYSEREIEDRVESVIESMMLSSIRNSKLSVISGGQRKRVQVAMQAVGDISFFTYDEPDSGLDVAGRIDQMNQLIMPITCEESVDVSSELHPCTKTGNAGLVISHYPDEVAHFYKKVIVLAKSKKDDAGHLAYYGDIPNALSFFGVDKLTDIVIEINYEGGKGRGDEFIEKFERIRRG